MNKEKILGFDVCDDSETQILKNVFEDYNRNIQNFIVNINPEIVINNYKNENFVKKLNSQKYQIPDGIGIVYASKIKKGNIKTRITGIDFMEKICQEAVKHSAKIFLYGSNLGVADKASTELKNKYQDINIVGTCDGYCDEEIAFNKIKKTNADIVFVALGSPKQENFIINNKSKLENVKIFMPVGGSFDVISKNIKRAPKWIRKINLEWLYRLLRQPIRLFRQLKIVKFIFLVIKEKRRDKNEEN